MHALIILHALSSLQDMLVKQGHLNLMQDHMMDSASHSNYLSAVPLIDTPTCFKCLNGDWVLTLPELGCRCHQTMILFWES